ncbi:MULTISPECIES: carotenoid biosynthesis protein [unclassified Paenibacillus]|uniref:carotenoid biosynthesis protein n=1 Tax=unclassified Paenibacillus TaxID=185978 RepID=UPI0024073E3C|nr:MULTISPECIES: carotenoid biosynthesis protein [unclassified Paenibacillus]MDF9840076.1 putative membrane protein [Paenibacillus sp. PastF-2]MDF9846658.1 putative membrane protein [Paenibacillus sp. PastM-2]MDF9852994.1 putative membrane protein [Paenibacillus sp. PastF-1]MDH6478502.1 putative membrane protein [Paenibacillus sp. PastH-2]MDH6506000.1 putative membrane protein [Paenibacillus sp. PastM-3]
MVRTVFWVWYVIGALLLIFFSVPQSLQFSNGLFLVFYAVYAAELIVKGFERPLVADQSVIFSQQLRPLRLLVSAALIWTGGMAVEWFGVHTGHLFGSYGYSDILGPLLYGVPVTLGFAWIAVVCNAVLLCRDFGQSGWRLMLLRAVQVGFWTVLLDLVLDPVAHARGFWTWGDGGGFYGVPVSNFIGWLIAGSLLSLFIPAVRLSGRAVRHGTRLYQAVIIMFGLVGLREGLPLCMIIAGIGTVLAEGSLRYARSG